ncbi:MAG: heterodisulfide reductase-related iron-sulfur binding cluster [Verrucomicrobiota bacterium]
MIPTRETFGNIPHASQVVFYWLTALALAVFAWGLWRRYRLWRMGTPANTWQTAGANLRRLWEQARPRLKRLLIEALGQKRVRGRGLPSGAHLGLFAGFMMLFLGTTLLEIDHLASGLSESLKFHQGAYYVIYEFTLDLFGLLFLAGCVLFGWRRLRRPASVGHKATDWYVLVSFVAIGLTGYVVEGLRMAWQQPTGLGAHCSPVGLWLAQGFSGLSHASARLAHQTVWWVHALLVFGFIASIPYTRLLHIIAGPLNIFFARPELGALRPVSIEEVEKTERIGAADITHFDRQQLLSLDACMECGRCEEACPAFATEKPLSPKKVVQDLKGLMGGRQRPSGWWSVVSGQWSAGNNDGAGAAAVDHGLRIPSAYVSGSAPGNAPHKQGQTRGSQPHLHAALHGETIQAETLWSCTACSACVSVCPVRIDPLTMIVDLRRNRVGEGALSGTAATALRRMQSSANPWGLPVAERAHWTEGLKAPTCRENPGFEVLYWVGCAGSYDRRAQRVARAVVKLLKHAGVNFAVLGREEKCTGESARRLGDEFLFQELAQANIATLSQYKVRKIVAHCPHCVNSLLKDYPQFGGQYEVVHHTQLIAQLIRDGRLNLGRGAGAASSSGIAAANPGGAESGAAAESVVTYHDPCYLARVNGIHEAPRTVLKAALGLASGPVVFREMPRHREKTFCCGAGGGRIWMEEDPRKRVSTARAQEALDTGAKTVAVGCPFCLTMMTDGVAANDEAARVLDVAELLAEKMGL